MDKPPNGSRAGMVERLLESIRTLNLTNVLIIALIAMIAVPTYFAYRFITDENLRRELMATAVIVDKHVPCVVLEAHRYRSADRHSIFIVYGHDGSLEKVIGMRATGTLTDKEIDEVCNKVIEMAKEVKP